MQSSVMPSTLVKTSSWLVGPGFWGPVLRRRQNISRLSAVVCTTLPDGLGVDFGTHRNFHVTTIDAKPRVYSSVTTDKQNQFYQPLPNYGFHRKSHGGFTTFIRGAATKRKEVVQQDPGRQGAVTMGEKVKQAGKDATYTGIVIGGVAVTGIMFFAIGRELFSGESPNGVYTRAYKMCKNCEEVTDNLGSPLKGYGEMTRRGRRRHTNHQEFERDGFKVMRMKFYVEGPLGKGTAQLEVRKSEGSKYEFRYLFVTMDDYPYKTIIIEDNR